MLLVNKKWSFLKTNRFQIEWNYHEVELHLVDRM